MSDVKDYFKGLIKEQILRLEMALEIEKDDNEKVLLKQQIEALKQQLSC